MSLLNQLLVQQSIANENNDPFKGLLTMEVTEEIVEKIADAKFAWRELIPQGHMFVLCAKANGGKTTFMVHVSAELAQNGYRVMYINADASASDIKHYQHHARDHGYNLINPDLTNGSAERVIEELRHLAQSNVDFSKDVIVLDTLKKFTDMMNKTRAKDFYSLVRTLTAKGMTVICLAHTNKYDDADGMPMFEGTGDTRNDCDELIYLIPVKNSDGTITVSTLADKTRAPIKDISFIITADREVQLLDEHIDTLAISEYQRNLEKDIEVIAFVLDNIRLISKSVTELVTISKEAKVGYSRQRLDGVCKRYSSSNTSCPEPKWLSMPAPTYGIKYGMISPEYLAKIKIGGGG
jgi:KaiC/GvpD/RAD55 family RecA-like ATPase